MKPVDEDTIRSAADFAFGLGLAHGKTRNTPVTSEDLMGLYRSAYPLTSDGLDWRRIHRLKLRQVYGASFDIAKLMRTHGGAKDAA